MQEILQVMIYLLLITLCFSAIVGLIAAARFIWITARFTYVIKLQKFNKDKMEAERQYNVISAENSQLMIANENIREAYASLLLEIKDKKQELEKINKMIEKEKNKIEHEPKSDNEKKRSASK